MPCHRASKSYILSKSALLVQHILREIYNFGEEGDSALQRTENSLANRLAAEQNLAIEVNFPALLLRRAGGHVPQP